MEKTFIDIWHMWIEGEDIRQVVWLWMPFYWWGRISKVMQLMAGLFVVLDFIGYDRLKTIGQGLRDVKNKNKISAILSQTFSSYLSFKGYWELVGVIVFYQRNSKELDRSQIVRFKKIQNYIITNFVLSCFIVHLILRIPLGNVLRYFELYRAYFTIPASIFLSLIYPFNGRVFVDIIGFPLLILMYAILDLVLKIFNTPNLKRKVEILSVIVLLITFCFDFLLS